MNSKNCRFFQKKALQLKCKCFNFQVGDIHVFCRQKENRTNASMFRTSNKYISREKIYETEFEFYALERIAHLIIDCVLDAGNAMIDGFIMRDPGSYEDIIDILMDERVISEEDGQGMKEIILLRKMLTQDYIQMNHDELYKTIQNILQW